ncbi:MAG: hypothetical protein WAT70_01140 [Rhizobiaceae bacterium]
MTRHRARTSARIDAAWLSPPVARLAAIAILLALSPVRLSFDPADHAFPISAAVAHAEDGEGGSGNGGDSNGGDDNGGDDNGGDDNGGGGGGDDNGGGGHGEAGSSVKGFLGALLGHGKIRDSFADDDTVILVFADGWSEKVDAGRYQLIDRKGRVVVTRKARSSDDRRLRAAIGD